MYNRDYIYLRYIQSLLHICVVIRFLVVVGVVYPIRLLAIRCSVRSLLDGSARCVIDIIYIIDIHYIDYT